MDRKPIGDLWIFVGHVLAASISFTSIAFIALGLQLVVVFVGNYGHSTYVLYILIVVEYTLFTIDILVFVVFIAKSGFDFVKSTLQLKN